MGVRACVCVCVCLADWCSVIEWVYVCSMHIHGGSLLFNRILMFGRLCRGLTDCCPSLHELLSGLDNDGDGVHVGIRFRPRLFSAKEKEVRSVHSKKDVEPCVLIIMCITTCAGWRQVCAPLNSYPIADIVGVTE